MTGTAANASSTTWSPCSTPSSPTGRRCTWSGHDWGSAQLWDAVAAEASDPRLSGRIASFTSISGPSLDHAGWISRPRPRPSQRPAASQALRSWYVGLFCLPVLPVLLWRHGTAAARPCRGAPRGAAPRATGAPSCGRNAVNGLGLYRANVFSRTRRPRRLHTACRCWSIHPDRDRFVTDVFLAGPRRRLQRPAGRARSTPGTG